MVKQGWLDEQIKKASEDIQKWDLWMRREAGLEPPSADKEPKKSTPASSLVHCKKEG